MLDQAEQQKLVPTWLKGPIAAGEQQKNQVDVHYKFYPSVTEVIDRCMPGYISGFIYGALVDSFSAEQNARMNAMSSANRNAEELIADLTLQYNGFRQSAITQEITEISAGAKALRGKQTHRTS